jgi:hypothetical protein
MRDGCGPKQCAVLRGVSNAWDECCRGRQCAGKVVFRAVRRRWCGDGECRLSRGASVSAQWPGDLLRSGYVPYERGSCGPHKYDANAPADDGNENSQSVQRDARWAPKSTVEPKSTNASPAALENRARSFNPSQVNSISTLFRGQRFSAAVIPRFKFGLAAEVSPLIGVEFSPPFTDDPPVRVSTPAVAQESKCRAW